MQLASSQRTERGEVWCKGLAALNRLPRELEIQIRSKPGLGSVMSFELIAGLSRLTSIYARYVPPLLANALEEYQA